jgi:hypothetical protein
MITNRVIQKWWDSANDADYDFMRWSDFLATMVELRNTDTPEYDPIAPDPSGGGGPIPINDLLAADGTNTIDNTNYQQEWKWDTLASGAGLKLSTSSTASDNGKVLQVVTNGANSTGSKNTYGVHTVVGNTGSFSFNYAGYFKAQSGTFNYGLYAEGSTTGVSAVGSGAGANGLSAQTTGTSGSNKAVYALSNGSGADENLAVYGEASGGATNKAGQFQATGGTNNYALVTTGGNVGFGTGTPSSKAIVEMSSTTQGLLLPRLTTTQMNAISSPPEGLMIYNTDETTLAFYDGTAWQFVQPQV